MNKRNYSFAVYYYVDTETGLIDYIGFDSHIDSKYNRNYRHLNQNPLIKFEEVLQKNPNRWRYKIFKKFNTLEEASKCEYNLINLYRPRFNFKHGGVGTRKFYQDFTYTVVKAGFRRNKKQNYVIRNRDNFSLVQSVDKIKLEKIAEELNSGKITEDDIQDKKYQKPKYTVSKAGFDKGRQQYKIQGKKYKPLINSMYKDKLESLVVRLNSGELTEDDVKNKNF